jgi:hypothetical protein
MVRTYIRKGGHGGDRNKADLPACYWQEKGGRAAAAAAKAAAKAKELLEEEAAKAAATNLWKQCWAKHGLSIWIVGAQPGLNMCEFTDIRYTCAQPGLSKSGLSLFTKSVLCACSTRTC